MRIAGYEKATFNNGEGIRFALWLQGCLHKCQGCFNPETWDMNGGYEIETVELARIINDYLEKHPFVSGLSLLGGDPMYQQDACMELLSLLPDDLNVWLYTGFTYEEIKNRPLVKRCEVIVDGPYIEELKCEGTMYGSSNQRIIRKGREL